MNGAHEQLPYSVTDSSPALPRGERLGVASHGDGLGEAVILGGLAWARHLRGQWRMPSVTPSPFPLASPGLGGDMAAPAASEFACRPSCGACCIAPSITSPLPGMPHGKPAGVPCAQLDEHMRCRVFGRPERPAFCAGLRPSSEMCGDDAPQAFAWLAALELATKP